MNSEHGGTNGKLWCEESENLLAVMTVQQLSLASRSSCCHSFRSSPGGNFTRVSWPSTLCYCVLHVIVPQHAVIQIEKGKGKIEAIFRTFIETYRTSPSLLLPSFITFKCAGKRIEIRDFRVEHHFKCIYHYLWIYFRLTNHYNAPCFYRIPTEVRRCGSADHRTPIWSDRVQRRAGHPQL